jgi:hypothetical protein
MNETRCNRENVLMRLPFGGLPYTGILKPNLISPPLFTMAMECLEIMRRRTGCTKRQPNEVNRGLKMLSDICTLVGGKFRRLCSGTQMV